MPKVTPIDDVLGWKLSDDGSLVMLGLKLSDGSELPIAFPPRKLVPAIMSLAHASGAIPRPKGTVEQGDLAIEANSCEVGKDEASGRSSGREATGGEPRASLATMSSDGFDKVAAVDILEIHKGNALAGRTGNQFFARPRTFFHPRHLIQR